MTKFVSNREIYEQVIRGRVPLAKKRLWIATADIRDMYVDSGGRDMVPFLKVLATLIGKGVEIRLIHAKEPGPNFREDFDRYPRLFTQMERVLCPRVHFKCVIVDGTFAWFGSANLTGAGMGAKSGRKRNFENGIVTDDPVLITPLEEQFDSVWRGDFCKDCGRKDFMRRFTFKLQFDYLDEAGKRLFFERMFKTKLTDADAEKLAEVRNLAPGDFRTVRQSMYYLGGSVTNAQRIAALEKESSVKRDTKKAGRIDF